MINIHSGEYVATFSNITINGTEVLFRALALAPGTVVLDIVGSFSNGRKDGEQWRLSVE